MRRGALAAGVALMVVATGAALARATALRAGGSGAAARLDVPAVGALRVLSLGHPELAAALVTARAQVAFGAALTRGAAPLPTAALERALTTAFELQPRGPAARDRLLRGAAMLVYGARPIDPPAVEAANRLLARGTAAFPGDWELAFAQAFNALHELPPLAPPDDPRQAVWRSQGRAALAHAAALPGAPGWLRALAAQVGGRAGAPSDGVDGERAVGKGSVPP